MLARIAFGFIGLILGATVCAAAAILITSIWPGGVNMWRVLGLTALGLLIGAIVGPVISQIVWRRARDASSHGVSRARLRFGLACWIVAPILASTGMVWASSFAGQPPPDSALLANFSRHRAAFDQIAKICGSNRTITNDTTTDQVVVIPQLAGQYRDLLHVAGVKPGKWQDEADEIGFPVWDAGDNDSVIGVEKGYAYLPHTPSEVVSKLDGYEGHSVDPKDPDDIAWSGTGYRHISGPWYLYYTYDVDKF